MLHCTGFSTHASARTQIRFLHTRARVRECVCMCVCLCTRARCATNEWLSHSQQPQPLLLHQHAPLLGQSSTHTHTHTHPRARAHYIVAPNVCVCVCIQIYYQFPHIVQIASGGAQRRRRRRCARIGNALVHTRTDTLVRSPPARPPANSVIYGHKLSVFYESWRGRGRSRGSMCVCARTGEVCAWRV